MFQTSGLVMLIFFVAVRAFGPNTGVCYVDGCTDNSMTFSTGLCHIHDDYWDSYPYGQSTPTAIPGIDSACHCKVAAREHCANRVYTLSDHKPNCEKREDKLWNAKNKNPFDPNYAWDTNRCGWDYDESRTPKCQVFGNHYHCEPPLFCNFTTTQQECQESTTYTQATTYDDGVLSYCDCAIQFETKPEIEEWSFESTCTIDGIAKTNCCKFWPTCTRVASSSAVMRSGGSGVDRVSEVTGSQVDQMYEAKTARSPYFWRFNITHVLSGPPPPPPQTTCSESHKQTLINAKMAKEDSACAETSGPNAGLHTNSYYPTGQFSADSFCDCIQQVYNISNVKTVWDFDSANNLCRYWQGDLNGAALPCYIAETGWYSGHTPDHSVDCPASCHNARDELTRAQCELNGGTHFYAVPTTASSSLVGTAVGCIKVEAHIINGTDVNTDVPIYMWFDSDDANIGVTSTSPLPDLTGIVLTQDVRTANITSAAVQRACHACATTSTTTSESSTATSITYTGTPTSTTTSTKTTSSSTSTTTTSTTSSTLTEVYCEHVYLDVMREEGWLYDDYGCSNAPTTVHSTHNLCSCAGYAFDNLSPQSFMFTPDDLSNTSANAFGTCYLYDDMCELVPQNGSSASNRNLVGCHHGCRNPSLPAVRHAQCDGGRALTTVTPHAIGCVARASDGQQLWLWPNATSPANSTPGDTTELPTVRLGGEQMFRVCNGKCERKTFFACETCPDTGVGTDLPTERECAESAPELYVVAESTSQQDCYCRKGTAQKQGADVIVRWQAYVRCDDSEIQGSPGMPSTVAAALADVGYDLIESFASCARCISNEKTSCSPHRAIQSRETCDVVRQALSFPEPLHVERTLQAGCFVATTERGQKLFWGGEQDQYAGHLQAAPDDVAWTRVCSALSPKMRRENYKLVIQTKGQCRVPAPLHQCGVNQQVQAPAYAFSGCMKAQAYDWNSYSDIIDPNDCSPSIPCLCVDFFAPGDPECYSGALCTLLAEHFGFVTPDTISDTANICIFHNGYLTESTTTTIPTSCLQAGQNLLSMKVKPYNLVDYEDNKLVLMAVAQCRAIAMTYNKPFVKTDLTAFGWCAHDSAEDVFYLTLITTTNVGRLLGIEASTNPTCETAFPATIEECDNAAIVVMGPAFKAASVFDPQLPTGCIVDTRDARLGATGIPVWNNAHTNNSCSNMVQCICGTYPAENTCPQVIVKETTDEMALQILVVVIAGLALILVVTTLPIRGPAASVAPKLSFASLSDIPKNKFEESKFL